MSNRRMLTSAIFNRRVRGGRRSGLTRNQTKSVKRIAKSTVLRVAETKAVGKQLPGSPTVPAQALFHNKVFYLENILLTKQGVEDPNDYSSSSARDGDMLQLKNVNVRFQLSAFRPNVVYKLVLFWYSSGNTLTDADVYFTQGTKLLDRYNTEQISIIDQKIIQPGTINRTGSDDNTSSFQRRTQLVSLNGNWKSKKITYDEGGTVPKFKDIGLAVVAYDSINTLQTDQIAELVYDYKIKFKDI